MRALTQTLLALSALIATMPSLVSCQASCEEKGNCGPYVPADGTSGEGGTANGGSSGENGTGGATGGDGAGGEGAEGGSGGVSCDTTMSPSEETCLVSDEHAVFVSPTGSDVANGAKATPVATLSKAVELAAGTKLVLVCNGTYDEHVVIESATRVYGGFDCDDWQAADGAPLFKPTDAGPALTVNGVDDAVLIEGVDFEVPDAVGAGASAVTAIVNESADVTLRSVSLTAGAGTDGTSATDSEFTFAVAAEGNGGTAVSGGEGSECPACPDGSKSRRGAGGGLEQSGGDGGPNHPDTGGEGGDKTLACGSGGSGLPGAPGPAPDDAGGATTLGSAAALEWWTPSGGGTGANGLPGQGGGGGAGKTTGGGGSGGCGGCGGKGGGGGDGGGASIGILGLNSAITFEACSIQTSDAGHGGNGAAGQLGQQTFGGGGDGFGTGDGGCDGGNGGKGGPGGAGGGGAGGISVGIVHVGDAPTVSEDTTIAVGAPGAKGEGGAGTNDGIAGVAQDVLALN